MRRASTAPPSSSSSTSTSAAAAAAVAAATTSTAQTHKESSAPTRPPARSRDDKKVSDSSTSSSSGKSTATKDDRMESTTKGPSTSTSSSAADDVYEFKSVKDGDSSPEQKTETAMEQTDGGDGAASAATSQTGDESSSSATKRNFSEVAEPAEENSTTGNDEESRRKKRKEEGGKEGKTAGQRSTGQAKGQSGKQTGGNQGKSTVASSTKSTGSSDKKSPCASPKPASGGSATSDAEVEDGKTDLKVPPLKIVIPQSTAAEQESGSSRNGKNSSQRTHQALPYVVPSSNSSDSNDKDMASATGSPEGSTSASNKDEKKESTSGQSDERGGSSHQRVLRSSHRSGTNQGTDRGSNNSSPQLQRSHSPSPSASPAAPSNQNDPPASTTATTSSTTSKSSDSQASQSTEPEATSSASTSTNTTTTTQAPAVELHPRKRKMKPSKEPPAPPSESAETPAEAQVHPHDQPITNCYQLFLDIKKQIAKRRRGLFPVQPKPPQGFKDYLMNRCTYVLNGTTPATPNISYPQSLPAPLKDLFAEQEKERYKLRMQHVIEKEKLVLSVEQEILRVHGRAARAVANQSLPFSVCTILRDEEVYNLITPEQEEKDRNARSRHNGRLFLSWLQDVDDKWEKIKEAMLLRHHNEAESLHAVQKMNWEWKMKELNLCDRKSIPSIDKLHVPMVHVSDDFDLLPA